MLGGGDLGGLRKESCERRMGLERCWELLDNRVEELRRNWDAHGLDGREEWQKAKTKGWRNGECRKHLN